MVRGIWKLMTYVQFEAIGSCISTKQGEGIATKQRHHHQQPEQQQQMFASNTVAMPMISRPRLARSVAIKKLVSLSRNRCKASKRLVD
jgi:hypothetical protein